MSLFKNIYITKKRISLIVILLVLSSSLFAENSINIGLIYNSNRELSSTLVNSLKSQITSLSFTYNEVKQLNKKIERKERAENRKREDKEFKDGLLEKESNKRLERFEEDQEYKIRYRDLNNDKYFDYIENTFSAKALLNYLRNYDFLIVITNELTYENVEKVEAYFISENTFSKYYSHVSLLNDDKDLMITNFLLNTLKITSQSKKGILKIKTPLESISTSIDNKKIEQNLIIINEGDYRLKATAVSYEPKYFDLNIKALKINIVNIDLKPIVYKPLLVTSNVNTATVLYEDKKLVTPFVLKDYKLPTTFYVTKDGYNSKSVQVSSDKKNVNINLFDTQFNFQTMALDAQKDTYNYLLASFTSFAIGLALDSIANINPKTEKVLKPVSTLCYIVTSATVVISISKIFNYYKNVNLAFD